VLVGVLRRCAPPSPACLAASAALGFVSVRRSSPCSLVFQDPTSQAVPPFYRVSLHPLHALSTEVLFLPVASLLPTPPPLGADSAEQHSSRWVRVTAACVRSIRCMQHDGACLTTLFLHSPPLPLASLPTSQRCSLFCPASDAQPCRCDVVTIPYDASASG
jgi:hypothetical protein